MEPILRVDHLTHTYSEGTPFERNAVEDMSLSVMPGEFLGIIGHTGSGKSTLIQHLNGLLKPTSGRVYLAGEDIWARPREIRRVRFRVGLVFQYPEYQLFEETAFEDIAFGPRNMGLDEKEIDQRVRSAAAFVGLEEDQLHRSPFELSGGQKRRVAIAGVIAMEPEVLILDEPTSYLDLKHKLEFMQLLRRLSQERELAVLMSLHELTLARAFSDEVVCLRDGRVDRSGPAGEILKETYVEQLFDLSPGSAKMFL